MNSNAIIFFDGVCNLCNSSVRFVIRHDPQKKFRFISLQDPRSSGLLSGFNIPAIPSGTFILLINNKIYQRSSAALRVARELKIPVNFLYAFIIIPAFIRDAVYNFVAGNRYRWFGKKETCLLPAPEVKDRFI
jgi:predicted DCC family thiol-disulfide oxidoreductase YuxK